jgi:ABC-2 type transport system permease protein
VQGIFPLVFVVLFVSSAFFPRGLLSHPADWVAAYNPLSYVADGIRDPIISPVTASTVLAGLGAALGIAALGIGLSVAALRGRLREA